MRRTVYMDGLCRECIDGIGNPQGHAACRPGDVTDQLWLDARSQRVDMYRGRAERREPLFATN